MAMAALRLPAQAVHGCVENFVFKKRKLHAATRRGAEARSAAGGAYVKSDQIMQQSDAR